MSSTDPESGTAQPIDDEEMKDPQQYGGLSVEDDPEGEVDPKKAEEKADGSNS